MEEKEINDVPPEKVEKIINQFKAARCTDVEKIQQDDGNWTIKAKCP